MIELSESIGFGYNLSVTQDGLRCWRNGINIFCYHPFLTPYDKDSLLLLLYVCANIE